MKLSFSSKFGAKLQFALSLNAFNQSLLLLLLLCVL
jgi:hypothetical protein